MKVYIMIQTNKSITCWRRVGGVLEACWRRVVKSSTRFIYENTYIGCKTINMGNRVCSMEKKNGMCPEQESNPQFPE